MSWLDDVIALVGQDQFFNILATVVGMGWLWLQRKMNIDRTTDRKWDDVLCYIEAGVAKTYQCYVKARKAASEDGTLTEDEKKAAREMAFSFARNYALEDGINLVKEAGAGMILPLIEKAVGTMKQQASGPQPIVVQVQAPAPVVTTTTTVPPATK